MISTEKESLYNNLEKMSFLEIISSINREDQKVSMAVKKSINKILFGFILIVFTLSIFMTLDQFSSIYFDKYIVPQQQIELNIK